MITIHPSQVLAMNMGDEVAANRVAESLLKLARELALRFVSFDSSDLDDLVQAGTTAAILALRCYDPAKGAPTALARIAIKRAQSRESFALRWVTRREDQRMTLRAFRERKRLRVDLGREPTT